MNSHSKNKIVAPASPKGTRNFCSEVSRKTSKRTILRGARITREALDGRPSDSSANHRRRNDFTIDEVETAFRLK